MVSAWTRCSSRGDRKSTRLNSSHTVIYTLSLHDALPISYWPSSFTQGRSDTLKTVSSAGLGYGFRLDQVFQPRRSEEHTSELQSHRDLHSFPTRRSSDLLLAKLIHPGTVGHAKDGVLRGFGIWFPLGPGVPAE